MLKIKSCELKAANAFVATLHRHHKPVVGHRFSIRVVEGDETVGVAIIGRPVARAVDATKVVEVTRLCTNGTKNACSILYAAAARAAKEMGYEKVQTYVLDTEPGTSLKAAGWVYETTTAGGQWKHTDKQRTTRGKKAKKRRTDQPTCKKQRWAKDLT